MPASPSFLTDTRSKWKKRKRETQIGSARRTKPDNDDDDEEEDNEDELEAEEEEDDPAVPDHTPIARESEVLSDGGVRISEFPSVIKHTVNLPHSSVLALVAAERSALYGNSDKSQSKQVVSLENVSYGQLQVLSAVPADQERADGSGTTAYVVSPPVIMEGRGVVKRFGTGRPHVVPMHSDWFAPTSVHRLERQVVPHFFSGKSADHSPEKYMECRNRIVFTYIENPNKRLSVTDCQGLSLGVDTEDIARIVRFLDHWGIINYCAPALTRESWNITSYVREDPTGEIHVPSAALKSIDSLIKFDKPKCRLKPDDIYSSLSRHSDEFSDLDSRIRERLSENICNHCSVHLSGVYYQSQKEVDTLLCSDCFHDGKFVINHSSLDFVRVDPTKDYGDMDGENWTDQETLMLLEAVEIYHDNWNEIAEHVGTKSKAQCILHFVRLPMEDGLLENIEVPNMPISSNLLDNSSHGRSYMNANGVTEGSCQQEPNSQSRLPFANSGNPVMSLVAFLASAVGPRVAAACAHASLAAMCDDSGIAASGVLQREGLSHDHRMNSDNVHSREGASYVEISNSGQHNEESLGILPLSSEKVKAASKAGLAAAATKAKQFADHEEREIQRLSANIINHQLKRLELKLKQFAEVETMLMKECDQVERARQRLAAERARVMSTRFGGPGPTGVSPPAVINAANNSRQQPMPGVPSQFGSTNQPTLPNMPFLPRQQPIFSIGPRLPLSVLHPSASSSAPSNPMFNAQGNPQPNLTHPMLRSLSSTSSGLG